MSKKRRMVLVTWLDSASGSRHWVGKGESQPLAVCTSVGFVHERRRKRLVLAQSMHTGGQVGHLVSIPVAAITKMRKVKP